MRLEPPYNFSNHNHSAYSAMNAQCLQDFNQHFVDFTGTRGATAHNFENHIAVLYMIKINASFAWITIYLLGSSRVAALTLICNVVCAAPSGQPIKTSRLLGFMRPRVGSCSNIACGCQCGGGVDNRFTTSSVLLPSGTAAIFSRELLAGPVPARPGETKTAISARPQFAG